MFCSRNAAECSCQTKKKIKKVVASVIKKINLYYEFGLIQTLHLSIDFKWDANPLNEGMNAE